MIFGFLWSGMLKKDEKWGKPREIAHIECIWEKVEFKKQRSVWKWILIVKSENMSVKEGSDHAEMVKNGDFLMNESL